MDLIKELNLESFSEKEKNKVLSRFAISLAKRIMLRVVGSLSAEDRKELDNLAEKGGESEVNDLLDKKISNIEQIRNEEARGLIDSIRQFVAAK